MHVLNDCGLYLLRGRHYCRAEDCFRGLVDLMGDQYVDGVSNLGTSLLLQGEVVQASEAYQRVLAKDSSHLEAMVGYSCVLFLHRRFNDCVSILEKAAAIYRSEPFVWSNLAVAYSALGLNSVAEACLTSAEKLRKASLSALNSGSSELEGDSDPLLHSNLVVLISASSSLFKSHFRLTRLLEPNSEYSSPMWGALGRLFLSAAVGESSATCLNKAQQCLSQSIDMTPTNASSWNTLGLVAMRRGFFSEAARYFHQAVAHCYDSSTFWGNYTAALFLSGARQDDAELVSAMHILATKFPDDFAALNSTTFPNLLVLSLSDSQIVRPGKYPKRTRTGRCRYPHLRESLDVVPSGPYSFK